MYLSLDLDLFVIIHYLLTTPAHLGKSCAAPVPAAPTEPQAAKKLDNLFFIEQPKSIHIVESKLALSIKQCTHAILSMSNFITSHSGLQRAQLPLLLKLVEIPFPT